MQKSKNTSTGEEITFFFVLPDVCEGDLDNAPEKLRAAYNSYTQHWDKKIDKKRVLSESVISNLKIRSIRQNEVYVFNEFHGPAFDNLKKHGATVLGAQCILDSISNNIKIPIGSKPVYSLAMRNMYITMSGIAVELRQEICDLIEYMGGICYDDLNIACTHLVAGSVTSKKYEVAASRKLKIMHFGWVYEVWKANSEKSCYADDEEFQQYKLKIFYPLGITSTGLSARERDEIKNLISKHGGTYDGAFSSERTHILILKKKAVNSPKFVSATKFKKECLIPEWVFDSVKEGFALPFETYRVSALKNSTPNKEFMQASSRDFNPNGTELSEISHADSLRSITIDETTTNSRLSSSVISNTNTKSSTTVTSKTKSADSKQSEPGYKSILAKINMMEPKKFEGYLDGCKVYLSGFNPEAKDKLIKILNSGGAIRFDDLSDQITHVIVGKHVASDMHMIQMKKLHPLILTLDWLVESVRIKEPAPIDKFLYRETSEESSEPEQPSPASKKAIMSMNHSFKRPSVPPQFNLPVPSTSIANNPSVVEEISQLPKLQDNLNFSKVNQSAHPENTLVNQYLHQQEGVKKNSTAYTEDVEELDYFKNKIVCLFGFTDETLASVMIDCESAKAHVVDGQFKGVVDFVITPVLLPKEPIPVKFKRIASELLIETAILGNSIPDKFKYYHHPIKFSENDPKPLSNDAISSSIYSGSERIYLKNLAEVLGARESETFSKKELPILIVPRPEGQKFKAAKKWGGVAVTARWLLKCFKTKTKVPFENYFVDNPLTADDSDENDDNMLTLMETSSNQSSDLNTLKNPAVVPSITADEINLISQNHAESNMMEVNTSKNVRDFVDDCEKYSQDLLRDCNAGNDDKRKFNQEDEFIIKHRRLSELRREHPKIQSPGPSTTSNISSTVNTLDLDTPAKVLVKKILHEEVDPESPGTKRLKQCMETPGLRNPITPEVPKCLAVPDETYARHPDETPNTRVANKRKLDVFESYQGPSKERRKSTPLVEVQKKFWKGALGDDYEEQCGFSQVSMNIPTSSQIENVSPDQADEVVDNETPIATRKYHESLRQYTSKSSTPISSYSTTPVKKFDAVSLINSPLIEKEDGLRKVADFIKTRVLNDKKKPAQVCTPKRNLEESTPLYQINSDLYVDTQDCDVGWKERVPQPVLVKKFMFTAMLEENKPRYRQMVLDLNGECIDMTAGFDRACTHLVFERPNRGEKVMAAIAAGKWCLIPKYLEDSLAAGKFLDEEDYEWGNPNAKHKMATSSETEQVIASACHKWRLKSQIVGWNGAFQMYQAILHVAKRDAFKRIIEAGGGEVLDIREPYSEDQNALRATHCFIDAKTSAISDKDIKALNKAGARILTINFLNAYLSNENVNPANYSVSFNSSKSSSSK